MRSTLDGHLTRPSQRNRVPSFRFSRRAQPSAALSTELDQVPRRPWSRIYLWSFGILAVAFGVSCFSARGEAAQLTLSCALARRARKWCLWHPAARRPNSRRRAQLAGGGRRWRL